jgi:hypothetical protein
VHTAISRHGPISRFEQAEQCEVTTKNHVRESSPCEAATSVEADMRHDRVAAMADAVQVAVTMGQGSLSTEREADISSSGPSRLPDTSSPRRHASNRSSAAICVENAAQAIQMLESEDGAKAGGRHTASDHALALAVHELVTQALSRQRANAFRDEKSYRLQNAEGLQSAISDPGCLRVRSNAWESPPPTVSGNDIAKPGAHGIIGVAAELHSRAAVCTPDECRSPQAGPTGMRSQGMHASAELIRLAACNSTSASGEAVGAGELSLFAQTESPTATDQVVQAMALAMSKGSAARSRAAKKPAKGGMQV